MSPIAWVILWFVVARVFLRRRAHRRRMIWGWYAGPWAPHWTQYAYPQPARTPAPEPALPLPSPDPFEALKSRFVGGDLTDEEYERELDALLKTPEGRRTLH